MTSLRERLWLWRLRRWVTDRTVPRPEPLPQVHLRAILCTWHEADIVATTVLNALEQGCDAVHLLDNASTDDTITNAVAAGATLEGTFATDVFPQPEHERLVREVVERVSIDSGEDHVWWLYLDADELVEGPDGLTIRQLVEGLDRSFRVVGSDTVNHYPRIAAPPTAGTDPRTSPSNAHHRTGSACRQGHWKHPLVRWDAAGPELRITPGRHVVDADQRLLEPRQALVMHHYPYRDRAVTEGRLDLLAARISGYEWAMGRRRSNLDAIYREAYDEVDPFDMVGPGQRFDPAPRPPVRSPNL